MLVGDGNFVRRDSRCGIAYALILRSFGWYALAQAEEDRRRFPAWDEGRADSRRDAK